MASTTFIDQQTVIYADWLNDTNNAVYNGVFAATTISPTNIVCNGSVSGTGFTSLVSNVFSAPGPIGNATPSSGAFTTLTATTPIAISSGGTGTTTSTGTGANVFGTSPTIATPTITGNITDGTYTTSVAKTAQGTIKAWVNFDGTQSGTITPRAGYNIASVVKNATGDYTVTFTTALADENYAVSGAASSTGGGSTYANAVVTLASGTAQTSSAVRIYTGYTGSNASSGSNVDSSQVQLMIIR
jgi:hypothetical protein